MAIKTLGSGNTHTSTTRSHHKGKRNTVEHSVIYIFLSVATRFTQNILFAVIPTISEVAPLPQFLVSLRLSICSNFQVEWVFSGKILQDLLFSKHVGFCKNSKHTADINYVYKMSNYYKNLFCQILKCAFKMSLKQIDEIKHRP